MITYPGVYHCGFNWGFNIAEAVNFATQNWLTVFPKCDRCRCSNDNVTINPHVFYNNLVRSTPSSPGDLKVKNSPMLKQFKKEIDSIEEDTGDELPAPHKKSPFKTATGSEAGRMGLGRKAMALPHTATK